jgi:hypothetical protein
MMDQSKTLSSSQIIFITFFSAAAQHWLVGWFALYQPRQTVQLSRAKTVFLIQTGMF